MNDEYVTVEKNYTWSLVDLSLNCRTIGCKVLKANIVLTTTFNSIRQDLLQRNTIRENDLIFMTLLVLLLSQLP